MKNHKVFISFSSKDEKLALKIYDRLNLKGVKSWISARDIQPGADYQTEIVKAVEQADIVVLVFSSRALASNEIAKELSLASKKIIMPARIEDIEPTDAFKYQLSNRQFIDLFNDFDKNLDSLIEKVIHILPDDSVQSRSVDAFVLMMGRCKRKLLWLCKKMIAPILSIMILAGVAYNLDWEKHSNNALSLLSLPSIEFPWSSVKRRILNEFRQMETERKASDSNKLRFMEKALAEAESALTVRDAVEIFNALTPSSRYDGIMVVKSTLEPNLNGDDLSLTLKGLTGNNRRLAIGALAEEGKIKENLTAAEIVKILKGSGSYQLDSIRTLASYAKADLNGDDLSLTLKGLTGNNRRLAIGALAEEGKIKENLTVAEIVKILKGSGSYQLDSIRTLASYAKADLNGDDLSLTLKGLTGNNRRLAIGALAEEGKIKENLTAAEIVKVLKGSGSYQLDSIRVLVSHIQGSLSDDDLDLVLNGLAGNNRRIATNALKAANKHQ